MKHYLYTILLLIALSAALFISKGYAGEKLGEIVVKGTHKEKISTDAQDKNHFEENIYNESETEYIDTDTFLKNAPSQKRITPKQALSIPGVQGDPVKAIQLFAGITPGGNDSQAELIIHGSKPRESIPSINHLPIGHLFHFEGLHSVIAPESIEQIDIYLGGFDVTYGNAMGGVIDITPKYPSGTRESYFHMGIYDSSAGSNFPITKKINGFIGVRRSYYDLLASKVGELSDNVTYTQFPQFYDASLIISGNSGNNLFSLEAITSHDGITINTQENSVKDPEATGVVDSDLNFTTAGLRWIYDNGNNYKSNTLLYNFINKEKTKLFAKNFINVDFQDTGLFHLSTFNLNRHRIQTGFELVYSRVPLDLYVPEPPRHDDIGYDFTSAEKFRFKKTLFVQYYGIFLQDIYEISYEKLFFRYGARGNYLLYESFNPSIDPRFALIYKINSKNSASFSVGRYTQTPDEAMMIEKFGNKDLVYERSYHYTLNYTHNFTYRSKVVIEPYYKQFDELAVSDPVKKYINKGKGFAYGLDFTYNHRITDALNLIISYTFLQSERERKNGGKAYTFFGEVPHTLQAVGSYNLGKKWIFSTRLKYYSGRPYTPITGTSTDTTGRVRPIYGDPYSKRLPYYLSVDLKISKKIQFKYFSLETSFEIMNTTNHKNVAGIKYDDNYNMDGYEKQLPLMPWLDLTFRF